MAGANRILQILLLLFLLTSCDRKSKSYFEIDRDGLELEPERLPTGELGKREKLDGDLIKSQFYAPRIAFLVEFSNPAGSADPFAEPPQGEVSRKRVTAQQTLENAGISFSEDSYARYEGEDDLLTVVQTEDQMDLVEAYFGSLLIDEESQVLTTAEIYRIPRLGGLEILQSARPHTDHTPERNAVLKSVGSRESELLAVQSIVCRSGQRSKISEAAQGMVEIMSKDDPSKDGGENEREFVPVGELEVDIVLGADNYTIDAILALVFRPGEQSDRILTLTHQATLHEGNWQLLGTWNADRDEMVVIFVCATIQRFGY